MDAVMFLREWKRACDIYEECKGCPLYTVRRTFCMPSAAGKRDFEKNVKAIEEWTRHNPSVKLTQTQKTAIIGRVAEGAMWITVGNSRDSVYFTDEKPYIRGDGTIDIPGNKNSASLEFYDFVTPYNSPINLQDLLKNQE